MREGIPSSELTYPPGSPGKSSTQKCLGREGICDRSLVRVLLWPQKVGGTPKIGGFPPKWMVKIMENPMYKWMIWGVFTHHFRKPPGLSKSLFVLSGGLGESGQSFATRWPCRAGAKWVLCALDKPETLNVPCRGQKLRFVWNGHPTFNRESLQWVYKHLLLGWWAYLLLYGNKGSFGTSTSEQWSTPFFVVFVNWVKKLASDVISYPVVVHI